MLCPPEKRDVKKAWVWAATTGSLRCLLGTRPAPHAKIAVAVDELRECGLPPACRLAGKSELA
jgi:dihydroorotase